MRLLWPVDAVDVFSRQEVAHILHCVRCGIYVIMTPFTVMAEAMGVLHTQVQPLVTTRKNKRQIEDSVSSQKTN